jgi:hypothetical protein
MIAQLLRIRERRYILDLSPNLRTVGHAFGDKTALANAFPRNFSITGDASNRLLCADGAQRIDPGGAAGRHSASDHHDREHRRSGRDQRRGVGRCESEQQ